MAGLSYMQLRGGVWWFRKRLPDDLRGKAAPAHVRSAFPALVNARTGCFKVELTASLKSKERRRASVLNFRKAAEVEEALQEASRQLREGPPKPELPQLPSLADIEAEAYAELLADDEAERQAGDPKTEPLRVFRRPFRLSHAATAGSLSMA